MATQSPLLLLEELFQNLPFAKFPPPVWAIDEALRRIVLLLNHILSQEKEASSRLARHSGRIVQMQWRSFSMKLVATPAGLLDRVLVEGEPDLVLTLTEESPSTLAQLVLRGDRPAVRIAGDVQLAAELNWLVDHVRWDIEEDLSRLMGDATAHGLCQAARAMTQGLREFIGIAAATGYNKAPT